MARIPAETMLLQDRFVTREIAKGSTNKEISKRVLKELGYPIGVPRMEALRSKLKSDQKPGGRLANKVVKLQTKPSKKERRRLSQPPETELEEEGRRAADGGKASDMVPEPGADVVELELPESIREVVHTLVDKMRDDGFNKMVVDITQDPPIVKYERTVVAQTTLV